jgi:hypothetical protein
MEQSSTYKLSQLPEYQSHKVVKGGVVTAIHSDTNPLKVNLSVRPGSGINLITIQTDKTLIDKHKPEIGWYYVLYQDGYQSFSPPDAFVGGYQPIREYTGTYPNPDDDKAEAGGK